MVGAWGRRLRVQGSGALVGEVGSTAGSSGACLRLLTGLIEKVVHGLWGLFMLPWNE